MGHYVRLALLSGNNHGPVDVHVVIIPGNNNLFAVVVIGVTVVSMMVIVWRTSNMNRATVPRND